MVLPLSAMAFPACLWGFLRMMEGPELGCWGLERKMYHGYVGAFIGIRLIVV
jgi:hypothetical protein